MHLSDHFSKIYHLVSDCLLCSPVIGLDLESHSHSREKVQFFKTRSIIIFLALTWRDEIEIIIRPFSYFKKRMRLQIVILVFRDEIETSRSRSKIISHGPARKNEAYSRRKFSLNSAWYWDLLKESEQVVWLHWWKRSVVILNLINLLNSLL